MRIGVIKPTSLAWLLVLVFLLLAMISYDVNDAGYSTTGLNLKATNWCGPVGAYVADYLYTVLGWSALLLFVRPVRLLFIPWFGISRWGGAKRLRKPWQLLGFAIAIWSLSSLLFLFDFFLWEAPYLPHGPAGRAGLLFWVHAQQAFTTYGALALIFIALPLGLKLYLELSTVQIFRIAGKFFSWFIPKKKARPLPVPSPSARRLQPQQRATSPSQATAQAQIQPDPEPVVEPESESGADDDLVEPVAPRKARTRTKKRAKVKLGADILPKSPPVDTVADKAQQQFYAQLLEEKLAQFNIKVVVERVVIGPVVIRIEALPESGFKVARLRNLSKDIARELKVRSVRVVEIIEGSSCLGIEIPNPERRMIHYATVYRAAQKQFDKTKLNMVMGVDIAGQVLSLELDRMPHLLVAGTTGSGKSVGLATMLLSLLLQHQPQQLRLVLIDPKMLELSVYGEVPHLLAPVVTDVRYAEKALRWCVQEMERRYRLLAAAGVRDIDGFNAKLAAVQARGEEDWQLDLTGIGTGTDNSISVSEPLPRIVVVIDELADMMMVVGRSVEQLIARLAQKARASGIHLIIATQRPSVDVLTGLIKANIPARIAFQATSSIDSRTILDEQGAENLLGRGDMLLLQPGTSTVERAHGAYVTDEEISAVVDFWSRQESEIEPLLDFEHATIDPVPGIAGIAGMDGNTADSDDDEYYSDAVEFVRASGKVSISSVQRQFQVGYNRAARIVERMESEGVVSPPDNRGLRRVTDE